VSHGEVGLKALAFEPEDNARWSFRWPAAAPLSLGWYVGLLTKNPMVTLQLLLASVLVQLFALGMPVFYIVIFDRVFGRQNLATLDVIGGGMLVLIAADLVVKLLRTYLMAYQMAWLDKLTLTQLMDGIFNRLGALTKPASGDPNEKTSWDVDVLSNLVKTNQATAVMVLVAGLDAALSTLVVAVMLVMHPVLAVVSLIPLIPIAILAFWNTPRAKERGQTSQKAQRACQLQLAELVQHQETLLSANALTHQGQKLYQQLLQWVENSLGSRVDQADGGNLQSFFVNIGSLITLYVGAHYVLAGDITFGVYLALNMISRIAMSAVQKLIGALVAYQEAVVQRGDVVTLLNAAIDETPPVSKRQQIRTATIQGCIEFHNVSFTYPGASQPVLHDLSFSIAPGERVVLAGKSGAGKTTVVRLLQGLLTPTHGYITLDGYNLQDWDPDVLRAHVGVAIQRPGLFGGTLRENIALSKPMATQQEILNTCQWVQLDDLINNSPNGLMAEIKPNGSNLSGGQGARIALARTLLSQPRVLVTDEALAALPPTNVIAIFNAIHKQFREATCLFVSHFLPLHHGVDRILLLDNGRIVEGGPFNTLRQTNGPYHQLYLSGMASPSPVAPGGAS